MGRSKGTEGTINAVLYIRVSSTQQVEEGYSIETQEKILRQYCEVMDWKVEEAEAETIERMFIRYQTRPCLAKTTGGYE